MSTNLPSLTSLVLLFLANVNCTVWYNSAAYGSNPPLFTATLDDNDLKGVCTIPEGSVWVGPGADMQMDCGNSGYSATASFNTPDYYHNVGQSVIMSRPGFSGEFGTDGCSAFCNCGSLPDGDCSTWIGQAW
ncbi:unnamed protein product [Calypogeia fissa]